MKSDILLVSTLLTLYFLTLPKSTTPSLFRNLSCLIVSDRFLCQIPALFVPSIKSFVEQFIIFYPLVIILTLIKLLISLFPLIIRFTILILLMTITF